MSRICFWFMGLVSMVCAGEIKTGPVTGGYCQVCDWTERDITDVGMFNCDAPCTWCPGVCRASVKCRHDKDTQTYKYPLKYMVKTECVSTEACGGDFSDEGWLEQNNNGNLIARGCQRAEEYTPDLCGPREWFYVFFSNLGGSVSGSQLSFCDPGWSEHPNCGKSKYPDAGENFLPTSRIIGGNEARENEFPYQARLSIFVDGLEYICGGTLILTDWVLTAAHCLPFTDLTDPSVQVYVYLGDHDRRVEDKYEEKRVAKDVIKHDVGDIALIKLDQPVNIAHGKIKPICKPEPDNQYVGAEGVVSGWGRISSVPSNATLSDTLQYVPMTVMSDEECSDHWTLPAGQMCVYDGVDSDQWGHCKGDSGGPLAVKDQDGRFHLVGIVKASDKTDEKFCLGKPQIYVRVTYYLDWIEDNIHHY